MALVRKSLLAGLLVLGGVPAAMAIDAPAALSAAAAGAARIDLSWSPVAGADRYAVDRSSAFNVWTPVGTALTNVFSDTSVAAGAAYLYRVRAIDGVLESANSTPALASTFTFTDDPLVPGLTRVKAAHVNEVRAAAGLVRGLAGHPPASYGEAIAPALRIKASHITETRAAVDPARAALGLPALAYANVLTAGVTRIRATDVMELRAGTTGGPPQFWSSVAGLSGVTSLAGSGATILAGTTTQGVSRSLDHGQSWSPANSGLTVMHVAAVAITPGETFFAGTVGGGVFRSTTSGATWTPSGASPPQNVTTLLPTAAGLFAASAIIPCSGISFSGDGGSTWAPRNSGLLNMCVTSMAGATDGDLFAGTAGGGVFRSDDDGATWNAVNSGLGSMNVHAIAVDALGRIHAATHTGGLFVSSNGGDNWWPSGLAAADVYALFLDPADELFAGGEGAGASVFRSFDGAAWQNAHGRLPRATKVNGFGATSRFRFVIVDGAVFRAPGEFRLHGIGFSPYLTESNGTALSEATLKERMQVLRPHTKWIRTFGMSNGLQHAGRIAHSLGLKAALGAWICGNEAANDAEIASLIAAAQAGEADLLIVGSEVMRRSANCNGECGGDCFVPEAQLAGYIEQVKDAVEGTGLLVGTAEVHEILLGHPALITAGTVVLPNYYPFWSGIAREHAVETLDDWHQEVVAAAGGKPVIVSETGWPSAGTPWVDAVPTEANAAAYFSNFVSWARANRAAYFYFSGFDENWKSGEPNGVGPHWGLWTNTGTLKPDMDDVLAGDTIPDNWSGTALVGGPGTPSIELMPPDGGELLRGQVEHVRPAEYRVAAYIYVSGWYNKPTWEEPLTTIFADGTFACDIVTNPNDVNRTQVAAFVVPVGYDPQDLAGPQQLPQDLYDVSVAEIVTAWPPP